MHLLSPDAPLYAKGTQSHTLSFSMPLVPSASWDWSDLLERQCGKE